MILSKRDWRSILRLSTLWSFTFIVIRLSSAPTNPKTMTGTIVFTLTSPLIIEGLRIRYTTPLRNAKIIIKILEKVAQKAAHILILHSKDSTIHSSTRRMFAEILVRGERLARKVSCVHSFTSSSNSDIFHLATNFSSMSDTWEKITGKFLKTGS